MSRDLIRTQAAQLERPRSAVRCVDVGEQVAVILEPYTPPNHTAYKPEVLEGLLFLVPATYDSAAPDTTGFYVKPNELTVRATGQAPRSSAQNVAPIPGEPWVKLSWKAQDADCQWTPGVDTLATHLATLEKRFMRGD